MSEYEQCQIETTSHVLSKRRRSPTREKIADKNRRSPTRRSTTGSCDKKKIADKKIAEKTENPIKRNWQEKPKKTSSGRKSYWKEFKKEGGSTQQQN